MRGRLCARSSPCGSANGSLSKSGLSQGLVRVRCDGHSPPKTIADTFRHRRAVGLDVAVQGLREALRKRKATPAEIADHPLKGSACSVMRPYLEAFAADET